MQGVPLVLLLLLFAFTHTSSADGEILSRRKRHLAFPEGSTLSIALCLQAQMTMRPSEIWTYAMNWGISYDLPNITSTLDYLKPYYMIKRRNRRDLYQKMETIMNSMGYNGKGCIYKALCETGSLFKRKGTVLEEIFKTLFRFPLQKIMDSEPEDHKHYQWAYQVGLREGSDGCWENFNGCSFSILDLALGGFTNYAPPFIKNLS
ncbi:PREDICTED: uncharacterized protein LOC108560242 [Nicrophorus vespilloides]|uniref:Uncharacterized protein LOC108560242 n=1 Tax=Nicrophorus vespilloides TaxID=110193 RepID=A0ABM1MF40_NICVS|nr:PREDICTED: uncharacterized protein LOC108560242 [Nicrophorus vespilloides]